MKSGIQRSWCLIAVLLAIASLCISAYANESGLLGIQIGATPKDINRVYGSPWIVVNPGGSLTLKKPMPGDPANWASAVMPSSLAANQQVRIYRLKGNGVLAAAFVIKGKGPDAYVTDIITASLKPNSKVKTERGVRLGDDLKILLLNYGYPPLIQPYQAQMSTPGAGPALGIGGAGAGIPSFGGGIMRQGAGAGMGMGGPGMMGGGPSGMGMGMGMGGPGMMGGGMMRPGAGAGMIGSGQGPVAPAGSTAAVVSTPGTGSQVLVVDQRPVTFTKNCVVLYDGLAFTLFDFKVVRIQVTQ